MRLALARFGIRMKLHQSPKAHIRAASCLLVSRPGVMVIADSQIARYLDKLLLLFYLPCSSRRCGLMHLRLKTGAVSTINPPSLDVSRSSAGSGQQDSSLCGVAEGRCKYSHALILLLTKKKCMTGQRKCSRPKQPDWGYDVIT
jgi:hypothetical protein